jgi:hypothetical protein
MAAISLKAHFDGDHILLDEPYDLPPDARLIVTVVPGAEATTPKPKRTPYELAEEMGLIGGFEGSTDLAENHRRHLREKLNAPRPD